MSVLRKRDAVVRSGGGDDTPGACCISSSCPGVFEMLTSRRYPDGSIRLPSTLLVFCEDGMFKGCLNDRDNQLTAWASSESFSGLLEALERGLSSDSLQWRTTAASSKKRK